MTSSPKASSAGAPRPNLAFRQLRGQLSPGEFAAAVRRAAREIGERVSCDARYIGRVEAGEIRCPNYAYERVFLHLFPGRTLTDLGFAPRETVRGRGARNSMGAPLAYTTPPAAPPGTVPDLRTPNAEQIQNDEESDVLRRAFMTGGTAAVAAASLGLTGPLGNRTAAAATPRRVGGTEASAVEEAVRRIRLLDDRHGAEGLYQRAAAPLRTAYALLDAGASRPAQQATADRLYASAGELSISVGWLAHDSGRFDDARSHYAEALATARMAGDAALEAHAFCNMSFLARDAGRYREAVRAAQAAQRSAQHDGSARLLSLLALREAGALAGLGDRAGCEQALSRAQTLFDRGPADADPEWMTFYGEAELAALEAQCWSTLGDWPRAARHARRAAGIAADRTPHFTRNTALYTAELADDLARSGRPDEAAAAAHQVLDLLDEVQSSRVRSILANTERVLRPHRRAHGVGDFLERHTVLAHTA
ncbi:tetratricopeptide repeat protein [Streptomyces sp. NPDC002851]